MKNVAIIIFTEGKLPKKVYQAACSQDYLNTSVIVSVRKPDPTKSKQDNIIDHMNYSRKLGAVSDADYFFFVESGVIIPKDAVSNLMKQMEQPPINLEAFIALERSFGKIEPPKKKHIIGGWYLLFRKNKSIPYLWSPSRWVGDNLITSLSYVERSVVKVDKIASGCLMMSREVLEKITWRTGITTLVNKEVDGAGSNPCMCVMFGIDAQDLGYELWMDGNVVCKHLTVPSTWLESVWSRFKKKVVGCLNQESLSFQC